MKTLKLSIAIITYNQEKYISQTLDSILSQEHNYEYEIVIGDDCSHDNTRTIINNYRKQYPNIIKPIYNTQNLGLIRNYFNVLNNCTGKYIMECAGDDWWLPGKVKTQIDFMDNNEHIGLCYGNAQETDSTGKIINSSIGDVCTSFEDCLLANPIPAVTVCFRNDLFKQYFFEIDPLKHDWIMEDYPMWLWFYKNSTVKYLDVLFANYRYLENSVSHSKNLEKQLIFIRNTCNIRHFFSTKYECEIQTDLEDLDILNIEFKLLLSSFEKTKAKSVRKQLMKIHSLKSLLKALFITNKLFAKIGYFVIK